MTHLHWTLGLLFFVSTSCNSATADSRPWLDSRRSPDERARLVLAAMTLDEELALLHGPMAIPGHPGVTLPADVVPSAGMIAGVPRLGIPTLRETDASLGIANPGYVRPGDVATALPSGLTLGATFDPELAFEAGALLAAEARAKGFNVLLGGGMNLTRDPRNGRNFEYLGEDPLLTGILAGAEVLGTQSQHVISTVKHFALNANETNRHTLNALIDRAALRESDLLAFELAIERGHPGAVMCAYNKVNGDPACANDWLLNQVLKRDWKFKGWVMSDWGAVHATEDALQGLDQQSGEELDAARWFGSELQSAVRTGRVPRARVDDMALRVLRSMFQVGLFDAAPTASTAIDYADHARLALRIAQEGIVLLKNEHSLLPLSRATLLIAVIGGYANYGVMSGSGSAQVVPANGPLVDIPVGGHGEKPANRDLFLDPSPPLDSIQAAASGARVLFDSGAFPANAAKLAEQSDVAIVFVTQHNSEGVDVPSLELPNGQNQLIEAVAAANRRTIVILESGNPVVMPWEDRVGAILSAWYPGQEGGRAIADVIFGAVNPSGRTPMTFPRDEPDLVRPLLPNLGVDDNAEVSINYREGADVGYRWSAAQGRQPLFAFGHGLSYTTFNYTNFRVMGGRRLRASFDVQNTGQRDGADVPQIYLTSAAGRYVRRLVGFKRLALAPGGRKHIDVAIDPRLLGFFDEAKDQWSISAGSYQLRLAKSADDLGAMGEARIAAQSLAAGWHPN